MCKFLGSGSNQSTKEESMKGLIVLVIVAAVGYFVYKLFKLFKTGEIQSRPDESQNKARTGLADSKGKEEAKKWIEEKYKEWYTQYLGYYLDQLSVEKSLPISDFDEFLREKGLKKQWTRPMISFGLDYNNQKEKAARDFLEKVGVTIYEREKVEEKLREYISKEAKREAEEIVKEFLEREGK